MSFLIALTIVLSVATAGHLMITLGPVRRLRSHTDLLDQLNPQHHRTLPRCPRYPTARPMSLWLPAGQSS
ncbi:hypothetical protein [Nocardia sp. NPDC050175]|uniref:hypothetical protein n=1 Tax=Nocardia sp. NPDC050175 TaxID=3364317 RepID=UPI0037A45C90